MFNLLTNLMKKFTKKTNISLNLLKSLNRTKIFLTLTFLRLKDEITAQWMCIVRRQKREKVLIRMLAILNWSNRLPKEFFAFWLSCDQVRTIFTPWEKDCPRCYKWYFKFSIKNYEGSYQLYKITQFWLVKTTGKSKN